MKKYITLQKKVGETPLDVITTYKSTHPEYQNIPMAYAGRLDPMASGRLLILIGEECKHQERYHALDKEYEFDILLGVTSDTGDVLGLVSSCEAPRVIKKQVSHVIRGLQGTHTLSYPKFSSRTVKGKPLHMWTVEGRLDEIEIPSYTATLYAVSCIAINSITKDNLRSSVFEKINSIPPVTDPRKALGNDFRRDDVRRTWTKIFETASNEEYQIITIRAVSSSGMYMRTLAEIIAQKLNTCGLAFSIHRTKIGRYQPFLFGTGFWFKKY